jgi:hypothetical protein
MSVKLLAALAASACLAALSTPAMAVSVSDGLVTQPVAWTTCSMFFYAPSTSGDAHAGETSIDMWSEPFKPAGQLYYEMYSSSYSRFPELTGELYDEYAAFLSRHIDRTLEYFQNGECHLAGSPEEARAYAQEQMRKTTRTTMFVPPPSEEMLARAITKAAALFGLPAANVVAKDAGKPAAKEQAKEAESAPAERAPTAAEIAAEKHRAVVERNRLAQEKYEAELVEHKRKLEEFEQAKKEVARLKEEQQAAAKRALAEYDAQAAAHAEVMRQHDAEVAKYEQEVAAQKLRKDFDDRHNLGQASTDTDANQCVTTPETQANVSFQGNTAASVMNGCGQAVDVRICLMTDKGWNCGVTYGLGSQQRWSHSSFNATGQVFSDARTSGSSKALASPN